MVEGLTRDKWQTFNGPTWCSWANPALLFSQQGVRFSSALPFLPLPECFRSSVLWGAEIQAFLEFMLPFLLICSWSQDLLCAVALGFFLWMEWSEIAVCSVSALQTPEKDEQGCALMKEKPMRNQMGSYLRTLVIVWSFVDAWLSVLIHVLISL